MISVAGHACTGVLSENRERVLHGVNPLSFSSAAPPGSGRDELYGSGAAQNVLRRLQTRRRPL